MQNEELGSAPGAQPLLKNLAEERRRQGQHGVVVLHSVVWKRQSCLRKITFRREVVGVDVEHTVQRGSFEV